MRPSLARWVLAALLAAATPAQAALDAAWGVIPVRVPVDSLPGVLRAMEMHGAPGVRPGEAAYALGQFRYARGEYALAADAFLRAYARLGGPDRPAARYGQGLSALALGNPGSAREAFEQVASDSPALRPLARWGVACCWEAQGRPEKAFDVLKSLVSGDPGESAPAALERLVALAERFHRDADARTARSRLQREYPRSIEAARVGARARGSAGLEEPAAPTRLAAP